MAYAFDPVIEEVEVLDIRNLPKGVVWTNDPMKMAELRMRPGVQLVLAPFHFSSGARKAINAMCLSPHMHETKVARDEGDRFRPDYNIIGPQNDAQAVAAAQINRSFTTTKHTADLIADTARAVEIF